MRMGWEVTAGAISKPVAFSWERPSKHWREGGREGGSGGREGGRECIMLSCPNIEMANSSVVDSRVKTLGNKLCHNFLTHPPPPPSSLLLIS